jgi:hypothetical protein
MRRLLGNYVVNQVLSDVDWWQSTKPTGCQLAMTLCSLGNAERFRPGFISHRLWPHTDGYVLPNRHLIWRPRLIVGLLLEDATDPKEGLFCVGNGSHYFLKREFQRHPPNSYLPLDLQDWRRRTLARWIAEHNPGDTARGFEPIVGKAGTIVFMHPVLMHATHPRTVKGGRPMIFFRHMLVDDKQAYNANGNSAQNFSYRRAVDEYHTDLGKYFK